MKPNTMVYTLLVFGVLVAFITPHMVGMVFRSDNSYETSKKEVASNQTVKREESKSDDVNDFDLAIASSAVEEVAPTPAKEEETAIDNKQEEKETVSDPVVYDGLTMNQLAAKLDRSLKSSLAGTGIYYAKYSIMYGVDPYLAVAISLHETGCYSTCNVSKNNVGGMMGKGGLLYFDSLESGIKAFVYNLKKNYFDKGYQSAEAIRNHGYATSNTWISRVNNFTERVKSN